MSRILVILTGGTIGSIAEKNLISATGEASAQVISMYQELHGEEDTFDVVQPYTILSENLMPSYWEKLIEEINRGIAGDYQGIILTHGSDTLVYTASFLGMMFAHVSIPIVLVAANYPLDDERSNGMHNFTAAVNFIKRRYVPGVYSCYRNNDDRDEVYLSTRMCESEPYFDQYHSFDGQILGSMKGEKFVWNKNNPLSAGEIRQKAREQRSKEIKFHYENEVMMLKTYPGINFSHIDLSSNVKAILIYMYHSATAPSIIESGLLELLRKCQYRGIQVYGASFKSNIGNLYETSSMLLKNGLIPLTNISMEAAYCKLVMAYNQKQYETQAFMKYNLFFEILE